MNISAVSSSTGGIIPTVVDILSGSVICILYCSPWTKISL